MKKIPADPDAEQTCLGASLMSQEALDILRSSLEKDAFHDHRHREIWQVLEEFWKIGQKPDPIDIGSYLDSEKRLHKAGGMAYLLQLQSVGSGADLKIYIQRLKDAQRKRRLVFMAQDIFQRIDDDEVGNIIDDASKELGLISTLADEEPQFINDVVTGPDGVLEQWIEAKRQRDCGEIVMAGPPTGFDRIDETIGGMGAGRQIIIGARTGVGKTEFASLIIANCVRKEIPTLVFSMEMTEREYAARVCGPLVSVHGNKASSGMVTDEEASRYAELETNFKDRWKKNVLIDARPALTTTQIKAIARRHVERNGVKVIFIDHMGLIRGKGNSLYEQVSGISRDLKEIAMSLNVCVVSLCQINRKAAHDNGVPQIHHLRDSGSIEQDSDQIILLHRRLEQDTNEMKWMVNIAKNRHGTERVIDYAYDYHTAQIIEAANFDQVFEQVRKNNY